MSVVHDYVCIAHGQFESRTGKCPHGCGKAMVKKIFLSPPAYHGGRTSSIDRTLQGLADDHGLSDLRSAREGEPVFRHDPNMDAAADAMRQQMLSGKTFEQSIAKDGIHSTLTAGNFQGDNALSSVKEQLTQPKANPVAVWDGK